MPELVITRALDQSNMMLAEAKKLGITAYAFPLIETVALKIENESALRDLVAGKFDILVLTSANGARFLSDALKPVGPIHNSVQVAVVGEQTAEVVANCFGNISMIRSAAGSAKLLLKMLEEIGVNGKRIFLGGARTVYFPLGGELKKLHAAVEEVALYETRQVTLTEKQIELFGAIKEPIITFLSPSAVESFFSLKSISTRPGCRFVVIGEATAQAVRRHGATVWHKATEPDGIALVREIAKLL